MVQTNFDVYCKIILGAHIKSGTDKALQLTDTNISIFEFCLLSLLVSLCLSLTHSHTNTQKQRVRVSHTSTNHVILSTAQYHGSLQFPTLKQNVNIGPKTSLSRADSQTDRAFSALSPLALTFHHKHTKDVCSKCEAFRKISAFWD